MAKNIQEYVVENIKHYLDKEKNKYVCIEDQYYKLDRFPRYKEDGMYVFKCDCCNCLVQNWYVIECNICKRNFCDITHTDRSLCNKPHDCATEMLTNRICTICMSRDDTFNKK